VKIPIIWPSISIRNFHRFTRQSYLCAQACCFLVQAIQALQINCGPSTLFILSVLKHRCLAAVLHCIVPSKSRQQAWLRSDTDPLVVIA